MKDPTLTAADHTWVRLQEAANPMASLAVLFFAQVLPIDSLKSLVEDRLMSFERFRQRILPSRLPLGPTPAGTKETTSLSTIICSAPVCRLRVRQGIWRH